jgi:hypothetical protein
MDDSEKTENRTIIQFSNTTPRHISVGMCPRIDRTICTPMFIASIFKIAKI